MNLLAPFLERAESWGERPAIIDPRAHERISFAALATRSGRLAEAWRRDGLKDGDRVLVAMPFGIDLYVAIAALWRLGAVIVFPEPALGLAGLRHAAKRAQPKALLVSGLYTMLRYVVPEFWNIALNLRIHEAARPADILYAAPADHPALISFTSGSTGEPKAIMRSHGFLAAQNAEMARVIASDRESETDLVCFPVLVIANLGLGLTSLLPWWRLTRHDKATAATIAGLIAAHGASRALVPPIICATLAQASAGLGLRQIFTGGGPVYPDILLKLAERHAGLDILSIYGSTEAEPISAQSLAETQAEDWRDMRGGGGLLAGRPTPATRLELSDDEIVVTGPHVNKSYLGGIGDGDSKIRRGDEIWHRTGDAGRLDDKGRLWLLGRAKAKAGRFFPFQVEAAARFWPGVRQAALIPASVPETLALAGDSSQAPLWRRKAQDDLGLNVRVVDAIPLDRRHRSKVDYTALARLTQNP